MRATDLLDRPIAFHRCFVTLTDSITAALLLSQIVYWSKRTKNGDGWFYKTSEEWKDETGLSRHEQETAREKLRKIGVLHEERRGAPAKLFYKLDCDKLEVLIAGISESSLPESGNLESDKPANKKREKQQSYKETETTSETTSEITSEVPPSAQPETLALEKPSKPQDAFYSSFVTNYAQVYGCPYQNKRADFVQLAACRKQGGEWLTADRWQTALVNYFASPLGAHTLADLSNRFGTFFRSALDRYGKPLTTTGDTRYASTTNGTAGQSSQQVSGDCGFHAKLTI